MSVYQNRNIKDTILVKYTNNRAICNLCFRNCVISEGKTGFCKTRQLRNGKLVSLIYGVVSALSVDYIEEKPFRHFHPGSKTLSFGSFGCNFRCKGCQNSKISWGFDELDYLQKGENHKSIFIPPELIIRLAKELSCEGIAFTYNEPAIMAEFVRDTARLAKENGLYTVYVTNSTLTKESIDLLVPYIDAIATDIKSTQSFFYGDLCGASRAMDFVFEGIKYAADKGIHIETRTNIITGHNDDEKIIRGITEWVKENLGADSPWHITRFHPAFELNYIESTSTATLQKAKAIAIETGLTNIYLEDKPCDCAKGGISPDINKVIKKFETDGIILNKNFMNEAEQEKVADTSCSCCG